MGCRPIVIGGPPDAHHLRRIHEPRFIGPTYRRRRRVPSSIEKHLSNPPSSRAGRTITTDGCTKLAKQLLLPADRAAAFSAGGKHRGTMGTAGGVRLFSGAYGPRRRIRMLMVRDIPREVGRQRPRLSSVVRTNWDGQSLQRQIDGVCTQDLGHKKDVAGTIARKRNYARAQVFGRSSEIQS